MTQFHSALSLDPVRGWMIGKACTSSLHALPPLTFAAETEAKPFAAKAARPQARVASDVVGGSDPRHGRRLS